VVFVFGVWDMLSVGAGESFCVMAGREGKVWLAKWAGRVMIGAG